MCVQFGFSVVECHWEIATHFIFSRHHHLIIIRSVGGLVGLCYTVQSIQFCYTAVTSRLSFYTKHCTYCANAHRMKIVNEFHSQQKLVFDFRIQIYDDCNA